MLHVWYIYLHLGEFLGQMLVNIPYMEHLGMVKLVRVRNYVT